MGPRFLLLALLALVGSLASCSRAPSAPVTPSLAASLREGQAAPDFDLIDESGETVSLEVYRAEHRPVLLYFSMGPG